jgi:hypothetical protein
MLRAVLNTSSSRTPTYSVRGRPNPAPAALPKYLQALAHLARPLDDLSALPSGKLRMILRARKLLAVLGSQAEVLETPRSQSAA